jgi:hypothetical protein
MTRTSDFASGVLISFLKRGNPITDCERAASRGNPRRQTQPAGVGSQGDAICTPPRMRRACRIWSAFMGREKSATTDGPWRSRSPPFLGERRVFLCLQSPRTLQVHSYLILSAGMSWRLGNNHPFAPGSR